MPNFRYQALNKDGQELVGTLDASTQQDLTVRLKQRGLYLTKVIAHERKITGFERIPPIEIATATRQLATLLEAGFPLAESLSFLIEQLKDKLLGKIIFKVHQDVKSGVSFYQALSRYPRHFSALYVHMVYAGEAAGNLGEILFRLAELLENQVTVRTRVRTILIYPFIMVLIGGGVLFFLLAFIVPIVTQIFVQMQQRLPLPTLVLISLSSFFKRFWWVLIVLIGTFGFFTRAFMKKPKGKLLLDRLKLRIPIISGLVLRASLTSLSRTLSTLLGGGVELLQALDIVKNTAGNQIISQAIDDCRQSVSKGSGFAASLERSKIFPPLFTHMVSAGEKSGQLRELLLKTADIYENELTVAIDRLVAVLEPGVILVMGLVVGFIVLAILLPIFEMSQLIR